MATNCTEDILLGTIDKPIFARQSIAQFRAEFITISFELQRYMIPIWIIVGIFGNTLSFIVWINPKLRKTNSSAIYLAALSLSDLLLLLLYIVHYLVNTWEIRIIDHPVICEVFQGMFIVAQYYSVPLVFLFTLERWVSICYPYYRDRFFNPRKACIAVGIVGGILLILGIIQSFAWTYSQENQTCIFREEWTGTAGRIFLATVEMMMSAVMPILTLVFNILVLKELRRITKSTHKKPKEAAPIISSNENNNNSETPREEQNKTRRGATSTTIMLLTVSFYLIISTLPTGTLYLCQFSNYFTSGDECLSDENIKKDPQWTTFRTFQTIKEIFDHLSITHYALNFIIYLATGQAFRDQAKHLLACGRLDKKSDMFDKGRRRTPRGPYSRSPPLLPHNTNGMTNGDDTTKV